MRRATVVVSAASLFVLSASAASAQQGEIRRSARPIRGEYIVVLRDDTDARAEGSRAANNFNGRLRHVYERTIRGFSIRLPEAAARALANDPRVAYVEEDGIVTVSQTVQTGATWGLDRLDQRLLPLDTRYAYLHDGTGVPVHVLDTGIRVTHTEFAGRAFVAADYIDDDRDGDPFDVGNDDGNGASPDGTDCNGHGTHVAGTIGGTRFGVAKSVTLWAHRVLDCSGSGPTSGVIAAVDAVTTYSSRPAVVNMSLSGPASSALDAAVARSITSGFTYVVAAGNDNVDASTRSPARVPQVITVGATSSSDARASFSNFGSSLDLFAPGVSIQSAWLSSDTSTASASGTSMASPHVAGLAALYIALNPGMTPLQVRDAIVAGATPGIVTSAGTGSTTRLATSAFLTVPPSAGQNVALASRGAIARASSSYNASFGPSAVINGDRRGTQWGAGGVWHDATTTFPDWVEVEFAQDYRIGQVNVFSMQDDAAAPVEPTPSQRFTAYGVHAFELQYWTGTAWSTIPGAIVIGNNLVWRSVTFAPVTTRRIRVVVHYGLNWYSRLTEVEAITAP